MHLWPTKVAFKLNFLAVPIKLCYPFTFVKSGRVFGIRIVWTISGRMLVLPIVYPANDGIFIRVGYLFGNGSHHRKTFPLHRFSIRYISRIKLIFDISFIIHYHAVYIYVEFIFNYPVVVQTVKLRRSIYRYPPLIGFIK